MSYKEETQPQPGIEGDVRVVSRLSPLAEKPSLALNVFCFFANLICSSTPAVLLTFPYAVICFFGKGSRRTKQAGLSALCGFFVAFGLFVLWTIIGSVNRLR